MIKQIGNVKIDNIEFINAVIYVWENGCNGVIERIFRELQKEKILSISPVNLMLIGVELYKKRNEIKGFFWRLKFFRRIFSRFDKLDSTLYFFYSTLLYCYLYLLVLTYSKS